MADRNKQASGSKAQQNNNNNKVAPNPLDSMTPRQIEEYKEAFQLFDTDGNGTITVDEIQKVLRSLGQDVSNKDIERMLHGVDVDENGTIDFPEFIIVMNRIREEADTEDDLVEVFRVLDQDGDGFISKADLREVVVRTGSELTNQDLEEMISEADKTGDGHIDYEEFSKIILSRY